MRIHGPWVHVLSLPPEVLVQFSGLCFCFASVVFCDLSQFFEKKKQDMNDLHDKEIVDAHVRK